MLVVDLIAASPQKMLQTAAHYNHQILLLVHVLVDQVQAQLANFSSFRTGLHLNCSSEPNDILL